MQSLSAKDFDENFNLINPKFKGKVVVLFHRPTCPHCVHFKPEYEKAARSSGDVKFTEFNTDNNPNFLQKLYGSQTARFKIDGVPTVVSFFDGQYFSTYGPTNKNFRTKEDVLEYASGIGEAEIYYNEDV